MVDSTAHTYILSAIITKYGAYSVDLVTPYRLLVRVTTIDCKRML